MGLFGPSKKEKMLQAEIDRLNHNDGRAIFI